MTEKSAIWDLLRKNMPEIDWVRIESAVSTGQPDLNGCYKGIEIWAENKILHGKRITFRPTQPAWIHSRMFHGGRVFVIVRAESSLSIYSGNEVRYWAQNGNVLANRDISVIPTNPLFTTDKPFDYAGIRRTIFGQ